MFVVFIDVSERCVRDGYQMSNPLLSEVRSLSIIERPDQLALLAILKTPTYCSQLVTKPSQFTKYAPVEQWSSPMQDTIGNSDSGGQFTAT